MTETIIIEVLGILLSLVSTVAIVKTELKHLTKQVEKHNTIIERTYKLESDFKILDNQVKQNTVDIKSLRKRKITTK